MSINEKDVENFVSGETLLCRPNGEPAIYLCMYKDRIVVNVGSYNTPNTTSYPKQIWQNWTVKKKPERRDWYCYESLASGDIFWNNKESLAVKNSSYKRIPELDKLGVEIEA